MENSHFYRIVPEHQSPRVYHKISAQTPAHVCVPDNTSVQCIVNLLLDSVFVISRTDNQSIGKGYQPKPTALIIVDITNT